MGQSASRRRRDNPPPPASPAPLPEEQPPRPRPRRPRTSTFRNSLLSLVSKRGEGERRASRRWSRAPPQPDTPPALETPEGDAPDALDDGADALVEPVLEAPEPEQPRERPPTPMPQPSVPPPPPSPPQPPAPAGPRAFPPPGTLVVVQGVVHTTDILRPPTPAPLALPATPTPPPAISSSSIDVLGTLLTVAAQATAASLLTGSSDTLLRQQPAPTTNNTPAPNAIPRRNPWGALRDRLGPAAAALPAFPSSTTPPSPQDERTRMLSEMARAFNLGLGLSPPSSQRALPGAGHGTNTNVTADADANANSTPAPDPEEGTFERFLIDLQSDLRVALTPGSRPALEGPPTADGEAEVSAPGPVDTPVVEAHEPVETPDAPATGSSSLSPLSTLTEPSVEATPPPPTTLEEPETPTIVEPEPEEAPPSPSAPGTGVGAVNWWRLYRFPPIVAPPRASPTASPDPAAAAAAAATPSEALPPASTPPIEPAPHNSPAQTTTPSTTTPPQPQTVVPVIVVGLQSVQLGAGGMGAMWGAGAGAAVHGVVPMPPPGAHAGAGVGVGAEPRVRASGESEREAVYDYEYEHELEPERQRQYADAAVEADLESSASTNADANVGSDEPSSRRRSWWRRRSSRPASAATAPLVPVASGSASASASAVDADADGAADADVEDEGEGEPDVRLTPLAPESDEGHQPEEEGAGANANANAGGPPPPDASRTFLIYVIGGYYPPEHGILTGAGGAESFEALLELGDLLGHVRPPTASKADIERAGLEVVRRDELAGRVTASCAERCLICLDDYEETDDIRVLSCRHAFHQGCVDRWLETGRNNCPACRTKGVPTETAIPHLPGVPVVQPQAPEPTQTPPTPDPSA